MELAEQKMTECACGQMYAYEPFLLMGIDFGKTLQWQCEDCRRNSARLEEDKARAVLAFEREALVRATIDPDLMETDIQREDFNGDLWRVVSRWRPEKDFWLGLVGESGTCKTRCMALLACKAIRVGVRVTWTTANRLKDAVDDRKDRDKSISQVARDHLKSCKYAGWLFLDDLGKNEWGSAFESQLFQILDFRKNNHLPVVYSSNAHPEAFSQVLSPLNASPIIGRLLDRTTLLDLFE